MIAHASKGNARGSALGGASPFLCITFYALFWSGPASRAEVAPDAEARPLQHQHAQKRRCVPSPGGARLLPRRSLGKIAALVMGIGLASGCTSTRPPDQPPVDTLPAVLLHQYGRVVKVNQREGFVVLECAVLPNEGERITLFRGEQQVGVVRVHRIKSGRHAAAEIEEGTPRTGDRFREDRREL